MEQRIINNEKLPPKVIFSIIGVGLILLIGLLIPTQKKSTDSSKNRGQYEDIFLSEKWEWLNLSTEKYTYVYLPEPSKGKYDIEISRKDENKNILCEVYSPNGVMLATDLKWQYGKQPLSDYKYRKIGLKLEPNYKGNSFIEARTIKK